MSSKMVRVSAVLASKSINIRDISQTYAQSAFFALITIAEFSNDIGTIKEVEVAIKETVRRSRSGQEAVLTGKIKKK
jgi:predicted amino acid-binding ACT domain protein